jgi:hypothetical protein
LWEGPADGTGAGLRPEKRGNTLDVPSRNDVLLANLEELQQDLSDVWRSLTRDPAKEARKERAWTILAGAFTAIGAILARKAAAKVYGILTGETAPIVRQPPAPPRGGPSSRRTETQARAEPDAETQISHT